MSNQWYYHSGDGRAVGPVTSVQLTLLATSGMLSPNAMVRRSDQSDWRRAGDVRGLFQDAPTATVPVAQAVPVAAPMGPPPAAPPASSRPPETDSPFGFLGASPATPVPSVDAPPPGVFDFFSDGEPAPAPAPVAKAAPRQAKAAPAKKPASPAPAPPGPPPPPPMVEVAPAPPAVTPAIPYVDVAEDPPMFFGEPGPTVVPTTPASTTSGNPFEFVAGPAAPPLPAPPPMMEAPVSLPEPPAPVVAPPPMVEPPRIEAPAPAPAPAPTAPQQALEIAGSTVELIGEDYLRLLDGKTTFRVHRGSLQAVTRYESGTVRSVYLKLAQIDGAKLEQRFEAGPGHAGPYPILSFHAGSLTVAMSFSGSDRPYRVFLDRVLHGTPTSAPSKGPAKT